MPTRKTQRRDRSATGESLKSRAAAARRAVTPTGVADSLTTLAEQLANQVIKPLGLVMLSRELIQETLDEAAERGRVTRRDANDLVAELLRRGRQQTDQLLSDVSRLTEPFDRLVRGAEKTQAQSRSSFPIAGYDDLTAAQVQKRLEGCTPAQLRQIRDYERRHANRKSVLASVEKQLG